MKTEDRFEQDLKELFTQIVADEPPLAAPVRARSWSFSARFFSGALSGAVARGFATASLAGAVAVGAVVAPNMLEKEPDDGRHALVQPGSSDTIPEPSQTPVTSAPAQPAASTTRYTDRRIGFSLRYPSSWFKHGSGSLGRNYIAFSSHTDLERGFEIWQQDGSCKACPVAVPVQLVNFADHDEYVRLARTIADKWRKQGVEVTERRNRLAGRATRSFEVRWPDRAPADPQDQEWCRGCVGEWHLVSWYENTTLDLRVVGLSAASYEEHGDEGRAVVRSLRDIGPPTDRLTEKPPVRTTPAPDPTPPGDPSPDCTPYRGSIMTAIRCDTYTEAALRFGDARVNARDAEAWLSKHAKAKYDTNEGGLYLYAPSGERAYRSYFITERKELSNGTMRFTLEMNQGYVGDTGDRVRVEHVFIGADGVTHNAKPTMNSMLVLDATLVSGPTEP